MSGAGRSQGRGESKNVQMVDQIDPRVQADRQRQLIAASMGLSEHDVPIRGRGGCRQSDIRTIPEGVRTTRVERTSGQRHIELVANYVPIIPMQSRTIQMYRVEFEPAVESQSKMRFLFKEACRGLFERAPIYDGVHECRSGKKLPDVTTNKTILDPLDNVSYTVKFTNTGTCSHGPELIRNYNMHMKDFLRTLGFYSPQTGLFVNPKQYDQVGDHLMMLRGFRTAANMHDGEKMLMNFEASHKIVQKRNMLQYMAELRGQLGANMEERLRAALTGKLVVTSYGKPRCYRVEDIDFKTKVTDTFDRNGTPTTFVEYFRTVHNMKISVMSQPLLKVVPNNERNRGQDNTRVTLLVPELCNQAGLTDAQRTDNRLKMDLIRASQVSPENRVKQLREFLSSFHSNAEIKLHLENWGYQYGTEPYQILSHVIQMTGYAYGDSCRQPPNSYEKADLNTADIRINGLAVCPEIKKLVIITARNQLREKAQLKSVLRSGFQRIRLMVGNVEDKDIPEGDSPNHYISAIRSLAPDTTVAIVIMQAQHKERYDAIKKAASVEKGLITQVVTAKLLQDQRKASSAAQKIAIQIAAKTGGEPWWTDIPLKATMICGYDTYHDTAKRGRSFGAFVASLNIKYSRWWSKADSHERLEEISTQMSVNIVDALKVFRKFNNDQLPEKIVIYRDGVGEGQLAHVFQVELEALREAIAKVGNIKLTMLIVNKRIGARFYARTPANNGFANPPPGTVVDHTVTRSGRFDFYLISQSTRQGTVTPTYYNIIYDECGFTPEIHQKLAFKLCLLYYNWAGTVRVPAPCQYAHKLAYLCGEHLHNQPNAKMDDKLHFL